MGSGAKKASLRGGYLVMLPRHRWCRLSVWRRLNSFCRKSGAAVSEAPGAVVNEFVEQKFVHGVVSLAVARAAVN